LELIGVAIIVGGIALARSIPLALVH
jgi:hypothetical protein